MDDNQGFAPILGVQNGSDPMQGYQVLTTPNPMLGEIAQPAKDDQEVASRMEGWKQLLSNPNLSRALMYAGVSVGQPREIGQTKTGHLLKSALVGANAFQLGQAADWTRSGEEQTRTQGAAESAAKVEASRAATEASRASTASTQAGLPGVEARAALDVRTLDTRVRAAQVELDKKILGFKQGEKNVPLEDLDREVKRMKLEIEKGLPEEFKAARLAELQKAEAELNNIRARTAGTQATTALTQSQTRGANLDADERETRAAVIAKMDSTEQKEFLTKTGRYAATTSKASQDAALYGGLYDKIKAADPNSEAIKGLSREEFQLQWIKKGNAKDHAELFVKATAAGVDDPDFMKMLKDMAVAEGTRARGVKPGATGTPAAGAIQKWIPAGAGVEYTIHPDGQREFRRVPKAKPSGSTPPAKPPAASPAAPSPGASPSQETPAPASSGGARVESQPVGAEFEVTNPALQRWRSQ